MSRAFPLKVSHLRVLEASLAAGNWLLRALSIELLPQMPWNLVIQLVTTWTFQSFIPKRKLK